MGKNEIYLESGSYYHVYNRAVGDDNLFYSEANYLYFLKKYEQYISPIALTYCYCLLPNHFHFLIRIKDESEITQIIKTNNKPGTLDLSANFYASKQFSNLFNGYSQAINKQQFRKGTLFSRPFKRKQVDSMEYLRNLVVYIHLNPVNHGFVSHASNWKYSSYNLIISDSKTETNKNEVINWFEDLENLNAMHENQIDEKLIELVLD